MLLCVRRNDYGNYLWYTSNIIEKPDTSEQWIIKEYVIIDTPANYTVDFESNNEKFNSIKIDADNK